MNKNAKIAIIAFIICVIGLCFSTCSEDFASVVTEEDEKYDICGESSVLKSNGTENCMKYLLRKCEIRLRHILKNQVKCFI